jgi:hypothetical protein
MYDKTTWSRVVPANYVWNSLPVDRLLDNMQNICDKPQDAALSHIRAGIAQLEKRGVFTKEEAAACLRETLKKRAKAMHEEAA